MTKEILSIDKEEDATEVAMRLPDFHNFGAGMEEIEYQALMAFSEVEEAKYRVQVAADYAAVASSEESPASMVPDETGSFDLQDLMRQRLAESKHLLTPEQYAEAAEGIEALTKEALEGPFMIDDGEADQEKDDEEEAEEPEFRVTCPPGSDWNGKWEAMLDNFLQAWPELRPAALAAVFSYYRELYESIGGNELQALDHAALLAPAPTSVGVLEDRMRVTAIDLREDGSVALSGECTWDEEHGFAIIIDGGKVVGAGAADL